MDNFGMHEVSVIDDRTNLVTALVSVGIDPYGLDSGKNGEAYIAIEGSNSVSIVDDGSNTVVAQIPVGIYPYDVVYDSEKQEIFVPNWGSNSVTVINVNVGTATATDRWFWPLVGVAVVVGTVELVLLMRIRARNAPGYRDAKQRKRTREFLRQFL